MSDASVQDGEAIISKIGDEKPMSHLQPEPQAQTESLAPTSQSQQPPGDITFQGHLQTPGYGGPPQGFIPGTI